MRPNTRALVTAAILWCATSTAAQGQEAARADSMALARQFTQWFYAGEKDSLWAHVAADVRAEMGSPEPFMEYRAEFEQRAGTELMVLEEKFVRRNGQPQYWRTIAVSNFDEPILLRWVIENGEITGIGMGPASQAPPIDPEQE